VLSWLVISTMLAAPPPARSADEKAVAAVAARAFAEHRAPDGRYCLSLEGKDPGPEVLDALGPQRRAFVPLGACAPEPDVFVGIDVGPFTWREDGSARVKVTCGAMRGQKLEACTYDVERHDAGWQVRGAGTCTVP